MPSYLDLLPEDVLQLIQKHLFNKCISELKFMTIHKYRYVPCNPNTNKHCVFAWVNGMSYKRGSNYRRQGLTTDGVDIYSYGLQIGRTGAFNKKILYDYTAKGLGWFSQTTSCHVGLVKPYADTIVSKADGLL